MAIRHIIRGSFWLGAAWVLLAGHAFAQDSAPKPSTPTARQTGVAPRPVVGVPRPAVRVPRPTLQVPRPTVSVPRPGVRVARPGISVPGPAISVPGPAMSVPSPAMSVPGPAMSVPSPAMSVPGPAISSPGPVVSAPSPAAQRAAPTLRSSASRTPPSRSDTNRLGYVPPRLQRSELITTPGRQTGQTAALERAGSTVGSPQALNSPTGFQEHTPPALISTRRPQGESVVVPSASVVPQPTQTAGNRSSRSSGRSRSANVLVERRQPGSSITVGNDGAAVTQFPNIGGPGWLPQTSAVPIELQSASPRGPQVSHARPGFGFYFSQRQCPPYYRPYFGPAPVMVAPTVVQQTVVVSQPRVRQSPAVLPQETVIRTPDTSPPASPQAAPPAYANAGLHAVALPTPSLGNGRSTEDRLYGLMSGGIAAFTRGSYEESARAFLQVMLEDPENVDGTLAYAVARFATGDYEVSALAIRRAVRRLCEVVHSDFDLRERYGRIEDLQAHWAQLVDALRHNPEHPDILLVLGFVQHFTGQREQAAETWSHLDWHSPEDADVVDCFRSTLPAEAHNPTETFNEGN